MVVAIGKGRKARQAGALNFCEYVDRAQHRRIVDWCVLGFGELYKSKKYYFSFMTNTVLDKLTATLTIPFLLSAIPIYALGCAYYYEYYFFEYAFIPLQFLDVKVNSVIKLAVILYLGIAVLGLAYYTVHNLVYVIFGKKNISILNLISMMLVYTAWVIYIYYDNFNILYFIMSLIAVAIVSYLQIHFTNKRYINPLNSLPIEDEKRKNLWNDFVGFTKIQNAVMIILVAFAFVPLTLVKRAQRDTRDLSNHLIYIESRENNYLVLRMYGDKMICTQLDGVKKADIRNIVCIKMSEDKVYHFRTLHN